MKNFGKVFGAVSQDKIDYEEKNNFSFPNVQKTGSQEMSITARVKKESFMDSFKRLGEVFGAPRRPSPPPVPQKTTFEANKHPSEAKSGRHTGPFGASSTSQDQERREDLPSMLANAEKVAGQHAPRHDTHEEKYQTAEKKLPSEHPVSDAISEDLHSILKRSREKSLSKAKLLERKIELERQLTSNKKIGKVSPSDRDREEKLSEIKQALHDDSKDNSAEKPQVSNISNSVFGPKPSESKPKHRTSQGLLAFLNHDYTSTDSLESKVDNDGQKREIDGRGRPCLLMDDLAEGFEGLKRGQPEESPEKEAIEKIDFEGGKRSRKSYFPEKLLRRVKTDNQKEEEEDDDALSSLAQQFKGPYFSMFSNSTSNMNLQDMFNHFSFNRDESYQQSKSKGILDTLQEKKEMLRNIQIASLKTFPEKMAEEQRSNILDIMPEQIDKDPNESTVEDHSFETVLKRVVKQKLLLCFDMISREKLLHSICEELDEKMKLMLEIKQSLEEIEVPKAENTCGEWTEERLFKKVAKEYNLQYFKYSIQSDTGLVDITFAMNDILFFSIKLEVNCRKDPETYTLMAGSCKCSPVIIPKVQKSSNPFNNPQLVANMYNRTIAASANDENGTDGLHFLVYLGNLQRRLNDIRRSMNLCIAKHKISDILLDLPNFKVQFMLFPKIAKTNFSMQVTVDLMVSEESMVEVKILSSHHKKRNAKSEVFAELDSQIKALVNNIDVNRNEWLVDVVDRLVAVVGKDTI